jgi:hypothetical protein
MVSAPEAAHIDKGKPTNIKIRRILVVAREVNTPPQNVATVRPTHSGAPTCFSPAKMSHEEPQANNAGMGQIRSFMGKNHRMKPFVGKSQMHLFRKTCVALCLGAFAIMAPAQTDTAIKVGLLSTLSGPGAGLGVDIRDGFQLAVKLSGGKFAGKDVEVIVADDQASPAVGRQTADR